MEVILDTSFILTCLREKIDFSEAEKFGKLILPLQVIEELRKLSKKGKLKDKENADLALKIINKSKRKFRVIKLEKKYVDAGIRRCVEGRVNIIVATLDKNLKMELRGKVRILTIRARKKLVLV